MVSNLLFMKPLIGCYELKVLRRHCILYYIFKFCHYHFTRWVLLDNMLTFLIFSARLDMLYVMYAAESFAIHARSAAEELASPAALRLSMWLTQSKCHAQMQIMDASSSSYTTRKRIMRRHACMLHASAQRMAAHSKDRQNHSSITLSSSTNGR